MAKYKKKPVIIDAVQWLGTAESFEEVQRAFPDMIWDAGEIGSCSFGIKTLEGWHLASKGDFIIKGVKGEFYPCKPDIFAMTYESEE